MIPANWDTLNELDQILVPTSVGYRAYNILTLVGGRSTLESAQGMGMGPLHFLVQRGPYQDGETPIDMRWDTRTIQIVINDRFINRQVYGDRRWRLVDLLRPNRSFGIFITPSGYSYPTTPLIYRKWLPGGRTERGTDAVTTAGSGEITSLTGKFVHNGLRVGMGFTITTGADAGNYIVTEVANDYTITVTPALAADATAIHWQYRRGHSFRDLYCLMEQGPQFNTIGSGAYMPAGYSEALRFVAHDPFWYGEEQYAAWMTPDDIGDLIFDYGTGPALLDSGAWLGEIQGVGRWLFAETFVGDEVSLIYWGHEVAYPTITITGPAENPQIYNSTTGITLSFDYTIVAGQTVVIDTYGLRATDNFGNDLYAYLTGDVASFAIAPEPQAPNRINVIGVSYSGGTAESAVRLTWRNKYVSF